MVETMRRYNIDRAVGDAYAAEWVRTAFASHGINYRRATTSVWHEGAQVKNKVAKPKSVLYAELLPRLTSGEVELLDHEVLISQLCALERRTRSGGRDSIDHPVGQHDDCANALAGVCDAVSQRVIVAGPIGSFAAGGGETAQPSALDLAWMGFQTQALMAEADHAAHYREQRYRNSPQSLREISFRAGRATSPFPFNF